MRDHAREARSAGRGEGTPAEGAAQVLAKLATLPPADRAMGERVHAIVMSAGPMLVPRLWYGMPAYAKDGHVICFFQGGSKFKTRYSTLGFSDRAKLDDGAMWPSAFALMALTSTEEARIAALVKRAVG